MRPSPMPLRHRGHLQFLLLALLSLACASTALFVSIDCGNNASSTYVDALGITWVGDAQYVQGGQTFQIVSNDSDHVSQPLTTLRYFPTGKKNCYTISGVDRGTKILLRASFYYGNYDGLFSPPEFDLQFDGNEWSPVYNSMNDTSIFEAVYVTRMETVSVCVAQTVPSNTPFVSSLELRSLDAKMYRDMDTTRALFTRSRPAYGAPRVVSGGGHGGLRPQKRAAVHDEIGQPAAISIWYEADIVILFRYPDDPYDRLWRPKTNLATFGLTSLTSTSKPVSTYDMDDKPPPAALQYAATPLSSSSSNLTIPNPISTKTSFAYFLNMYFHEVSANTTRNFTLLLDGKMFVNEPIVPNEFVQEFYIKSKNLSSDSIFMLLRGDGCAFPPIINAAEFFLIGDSPLTSGTDRYDVAALSELQKNYVHLQAWSGDPCLPTGYNWEWLACSSEENPRIIELHLSGYGLSGPLADFSALSALRIVDLHNNSLSGSIPDFLGQFANLTELNMADNRFTGSLPQSLVSNSKLKLNISGNSITNPNSSRKTKVGLTVGSILGALCFLALLIAASITLFYRKRQKRNAASTNISAATKQHNPRDPGTTFSFTYAEIIEITGNFTMLIGQGGSGNVFYGRLKDGCEVAVKVLNESLHRTKEFVSEVNLLLTVHHKYLVAFVGYCEEGENLILLYEYMQIGNLRQLLSGRSRMSEFLTWEKRLQIALNVATGIDYLHSGCQSPIIHRDVKSSNILLNEKLEAKVADFGLSKSGLNDDVSYLSTVVAGTPGYIDPEYSATNMLTKKSDVYSFGVVLFELMSGGSPIFATAEERCHIVQWTTQKLKRGDIHGVADPNVRGQYSVNSMWKIADIAMSCTSPASSQRPNMSDVVIQLKEAIEAETRQDATVYSFTEFDPAATSATLDSTANMSLMPSPKER